MRDNIRTPRLPAGAMDRVLDALPDGILVIDAHGVICYVNRAGRSLFRRPAEDLIGHTFETALPCLANGGLLRRVRTTGAPATWSGSEPVTGRPLTATALTCGEGLVQITLRVTDLPAEHVAVGRLGFLAEVSDAMIATLDTGESATRLAELAVSRLCDWAVVALAGEDGTVAEEAWAHRDPAAGADLDTYMTGRLQNTGDDAAMIDALLTGRPVQVPVTEDRVAPSLPTKTVRDAWRRLRTSSATIVPLRARGATFGALAMLNTGHRPPLDAEEIGTAVEAARRGALALDNARLYGRQQAVAEKLQRSLLTEPPQPDDLQLAVRYRPASSHLHVGGDWYDAFPQPDGATLLVIGDVVGHDIDAAATMGQIRTLVRGIAYDRHDSPAQLLTRVDDVLAGLRVASLATALIARIEQPEHQRRQGLRTLRWSSAGHLPPLVLHADGTMHALSTRPERLLGTDDRVPRSDHAVSLRPGDTVLLYTDGLVEHGRTGIDEGLARLADALATLHAVPVEELCDQLLSQMLTDDADDDVALLAVRAHPQAGHAPDPVGP